MTKYFSKRKIRNYCKLQIVFLKVAMCSKEDEEPSRYIKCLIKTSYDNLAKSCLRGLEVTGKTKISSSPLITFNISSCTSCHSHHISKESVWIVGTPGLLKWRRFGDVFTANTWPDYLKHIREYEKLYSVTNISSWWSLVPNMNSSRTEETRQIR